MTRFEELPQEVRDKALSDVYCIRCQQAFSMREYQAREFRGQLMIEGKCPTCGETAVKPVSSR